MRGVAAVLLRTAPLSHPAQKAASHGIPLAAALQFFWPHLSHSIGLYFLLKSVAEPVLFLFQIIVRL